ncbi:MAG: hypothetical protein WBL74_09275 [Novosphingobium sp.]|uniref:hypothetical protein n=1 Tax=Novosphingobium sp. TaxID=1874826 RepID=UPI003C7BFCE2
MKKIYCPVVRKGGKCAVLLKTCRYCGVVSCDISPCPIRYFSKPYNKCRRCGRKWAGFRADSGGRISAMKPFKRLERNEFMLSDAAVVFRHQIQDGAGFLSTCDGGDPGSVEEPSVWLLGIEPGWSLADEATDEVPSPEAEQRLRAYSIELQLEWPFNRNAFKLLATVEGGSPDDYREFAKRAQPFALNSKGYLKGNLFPVPFNNVGAWDEAATAMTGFATKDEYQSWVREVRFPILQTWIERCRPRLLIGSGISHLADFLAITSADKKPSEFQFEVNGHSKRVFIGKNGVVPVAIVPHLSGGIHSLNSNQSIAQTAAIIRSELGI